MIRISANGLETQAVEEHTCVRMGAVAVLTKCCMCGNRVVAIILADRPEYCAMECKNCGTSAEIAIGD